MTDANPFRNVFNDPDFQQRMAEANAYSAHYTRVGNRHFLIGPESISESNDGYNWTRLDPDQAQEAHALIQRKRDPDRNVAQDPEFQQQMAKDAQQASPETLARYYASLGSQLNQTHNAHTARAIAAYEEARMGPKPKPKFILEIKDSHFYAKPSRGTIWDVVIVAVTGACWFGFLFSLWVIFA